MISVSRRALFAGAGIAGVAAAAPALARQPRVDISDLRANNMVQPMGLEDQDLRLSWRLDSPDRGLRQVSYEILAASSRDLIEAGTPDMWWAGEFLTDKTFDVGWLGRPLRSRETVHWQVIVRDHTEARTTGPMSSFEMGLLNEDDWSADWIEAETELARADRLAGLLWMRGDRPEDGSARYFRLAFDLPERADVSLFSIANFTYDLHLDGAPVERPVHSPIAFGTDPINETRHSLSAGRHVLAIRVEDPEGFNSPKLHEIATAVMVRAELASGRTIRITSEGMKTALDAPGGWTSPRFNDRGWAQAEPSQNQPQMWDQCGAFLLRKDFRARGPIARARLYATALGAYEAHINGARVGDALLTPESTDFRETVLYRTYDVTSMLRPGDNAIGAMIADGWYGSYHAPAGRFAFGDPPLRFLGQLEITYADGSMDTIVTDDSWKLSDEAPVVRSEIYYGEDYDARLEKTGWAEPGFDDSSWRQARVGEAPPAELKAHVAPPLRRIETLSAESITQVGPDAWVLDFGQNFAGWARLSMRGQAGQTATLKFAEVLLPDGRVDQSNLRAARAANVYTFKGDPAGETYEPHFTYFGFRYVQVEGLGRAPTAEEIQGIVVSSDLEETGHLRINNPVIHGLWRNSLWSQRSNFFGVPTDCPQRDERLGWTGDAHVFWDAAAFNMNVAPFTRRFARDMRDGQGPRGEYPDYAPAGWRDLSLGASPGWADAGVMLPWTNWKRYGDTLIVDQNWAAMIRYLDFILEHNPDLIWRNQRGYDFGDWVALDAVNPGDETTPKALIATAMWKRSVEATAEMAYGSQRRPQGDRYSALAERIGAAFQAEFIRPDGRIGNGSQAGYILALRFGLVPEDLRQAATGHLTADIRRRGTLLSTGFLGTPFSLDALADNGEAALVYDLLLRTDFPSWGYMIRQGATTIWERWNGDTGDVAMNSFNHYALGAVTGFIFRRIAGIEPTSAGFLTFDVNPVLDPRVPRGGGDYDSVVGRISTDWEILSSGGFTLSLTAPANTIARVFLPAASPDRVREGGRALDQAEGVSVLGREGDRLVVQVMSGTYRFDVRG